MSAGDDSDKLGFTNREARTLVRKAVAHVPEGESIRHLNIMPMMDMMTILLVAFIFQLSTNALDVIAILERMTPTSCVRFSAALASPLNELSERELRPISKSLAARTFTCSGCFGP